MKKSLFGLTLTDLQSLCSELSVPAFRAKQLAHWLYQRRVSSFESMNNMPKSLLETLQEDYFLDRPAPLDVQESRDGTKKYLFPVGDGRAVEAVYIPDKDRATLCISSQVGCKRACKFCMTGKQGFQGNLSTGEILNQIFSLPEFDQLTNIVYMGMGEPLDNLQAVLNSLEVLTSEWGLAWSPRRITVSTVGILPELKELIEQSQAHIAVSMHNPLGRQRRDIMPVEKVHPISDVLELLRIYDFGRQRRVSFEYIMFEGINDQQEHLQAIPKLLKGLRCRFNLISYHAIPGEELQGSSPPVMEQFRDGLSAKGITCTIRASRGQDILAACGMLSSKNKGN